MNVQPFTPPELADAAEALQAAINDCDDNDIPILELSLDRDDWVWLVAAFLDARDGLDCTIKLAQFADRLHAALNPGGAS